MYTVYYNTHHLFHKSALKKSKKRNDGKTPEQRSAAAKKAWETIRKNREKTLREAGLVEEGVRFLLVLKPGLRDEFEEICKSNHYSTAEGIRQAMREFIRAHPLN